MAARKKKSATASARSAKKTSTRGKKAAAPAQGGAASDQEMLIVGSKARQAIKDAGCNTGGDALEGLNTWAHWLVKQAVARASANGRKTVRKHDFMVGM